MRSLKKIVSLLLAVSLIVGNAGAYARSAGNESLIENAEAGSTGTGSQAEESYEYAPAEEPHKEIAGTTEGIAQEVPDETIKELYFDNEEYRQGQSDGGEETAAPEEAEGSESGEPIAGEEAAEDADVQEKEVEVADAAQAQEEEEEPADAAQDRGKEEEAADAAQLQGKEDEAADAAQLQGKEDEAADTVQVQEEEEEPADGAQEDIKELTEVPESPDETLLNTENLSAMTRRMTVSRKALLAASPQVQTPVTKDGMTIEKIRLKWLSRSSGSDTSAGYDTLILSPEADEMSGQQWQMDFALSGENKHEAGSVEIVMPAFIWLDRNGEEPGRLTLAVPEDPEKGMDFSWKRIGDTIVFTNVREISAAGKYMIQGTFRDFTAHEMIDRDVAEGSEYKDAFSPGKSDKLVAQISVTTPGGSTISMMSNEIDAEINTCVSAAYASKTAYNTATNEYYMYWDTPSNIPQDFLPADAEDYCYVRWYVSGQAQGNQPFVMTVSDTLTEEYDGLMLGIEDADGQDIKSTDGETVSAQLFAGYNTKPKTAYVWTAYKKAAFTEEAAIYTVHNTQTISVQGVDDLIVTTKQASSECSIAIPIRYMIVKEWDDNDDEMGLRPDHQDVQIYRNPRGENNVDYWKTVRLVENPTAEQIAQGYGEWSYAWLDEGKSYHYETNEPYTASGSFETYYDGEGKIHKKNWSYGLKEKTYDPDLRKWTYVNELTVSGYDGDFADIDKTVYAQYDDPYKKSLRDRAVNELMNGKDAIIPYKVRGIMGSIQTYKDNQQAGNIDAHRTDIVLEDYLNMFNNRRVTEEDMDLAYVILENPLIYGYTAAVRDPSLPQEDPDRYYVPARYTLSKYPDEDTDAVFEAYIGGEWKEVADLHDNVLTTRNGACASGLKITLPEGTEQFRERVSTFGAVTELTYTIGVRIHPSESVMADIDDAGALSDYMMLTADNYAKLYARENESVVSDVLSDWDRGYIHGRIYRVAAWQNKEFIVTGNDTVNRRISVHTGATVTQQSNVSTDAEYDRAVKNKDIPFTTGGRWYDLLPKGVNPDVSSVRLQDGDKIKDVQTVSDYLGTGRTLLIVNAALDGHVSYTQAGSSNPHYSDETYPKEGYKQSQRIEFDSYISWEDAQLFGLNTMRNTIAFSTDDDRIGNLEGWSGERDDPDGGANKWSRSETAGDIDLMSGFESGRQEPTFVYAGADLITDELDFAAETSIRKWVSAEGSGLWSFGLDDDVTVQEGGKYTYRINVRSESETTAKNIIVLDAIENYVPVSGQSNFSDAQWKGRFIKLDTSELEAAGIDPVVYYTTKEDIKISKEEGGYNVNNEQGVIASVLEDPDGDWSRVLPENLSAVTGFAVDCRRAKDGSDFVLTDEKPLALYVHMRAPAKNEAAEIWGAGKDAPEDPAQIDLTNPDHNAHAYNNVYLDSTQVDSAGQETHAYIHWDYTKVGIVPFSLTVEKEWNDMDNNDGIRPGRAVVKLLADGAETGEVVTLDESNGWRGSFEHLLKYDFDDGDPQYSGRDDGHYISYSFEEENTADGYVMSYARTGNDVTVINTHIPEKISVPYTKTWAGDEHDLSTRPGAVYVRLYADGIFTGSRKEVSADEDGQWAGSFDNLYRYRNGQEIAYTIREEPVDDYLTQISAGDITNTYYPYGDLYVEKKVVNATASAMGRAFTFTLVLTDSDGNDLTEKYDYRITDENDAVISSGKIGNGGQFSLGDGQKMHVTEIPSHSLYEVSEDRAKGFTAQCTDAAGEILTGIPAQAVFINTYASAGRAEIKANKILTGRRLEKYQFTYEIYKIPDQGEPFLVRTGANREDGTIAFGSFVFTDADDGHSSRFKIVEKNSAAPGYTYDENEYFANITPHDNGNGTMRFDIVYEDAQGNTLEESDNPVTFTNTYRAGGSISLKAWKQLLGRSLAEEEFTFRLYSEEKDETGKNILLGSAKNTQDGSISFDGISFTEEDIGKTFYFFAEEEVGEDETVIYDRSVFGYKVEVIDNGDGTLSFNQTHVSAVKTAVPGQEEAQEEYAYSAGDPVSEVPLFVNRLKEGTVTVSKYTISEAGDEPDPDTQFSFKIKFTDPEGKAVSAEELQYGVEGGTSTATDGPNNEIAFTLKAGEKAAFSGIPGGSAYQVWEELPSGWQMVRQENPAGTVVPGGVTDVEFYNQYYPGTATVTLMAAKTLDANVPEEGAYQFELIGPDGNLIGTKSNNAAGIVQFDQITFTEPGSFVYQIREVRGDDGGINYDTKTVAITVTVTRDAAGNLTAESSASAALPTFENVTKPGVLTITKEVEGGSNTQTFTFEVEFTNENGQSLDRVNIIGDVQ